MRSSKNWSRASHAAISARAHKTTSSMRCSTSGGHCAAAGGPAACGVDFVVSARPLPGPSGVCWLLCINPFCAARVIRVMATRREGSVCRSAGNKCGDCSLAGCLFPVWETWRESGKLAARDGRKTQLSLGELLPGLPGGSFPGGPGEETRRGLKTIHCYQATSRRGGFARRPRCGSRQRVDRRVSRRGVLQA